MKRVREYTYVEPLTTERNHVATLGSDRPGRYGSHPQVDHSLLGLLWCGPVGPEGTAMPALTRRQLLLRAAWTAPVLALNPSRALSAPPPASPPLLPALAAKAAFDSYGMNCHFSFLQSVWTNTDSAVQWLLDLKVGSVRQSLPRSPQGRDAVKRAINGLAVGGVRWCCPTLVLADASSLVAARAAVNEQLDWLQVNADLALLDSLPGLNEPNAGGGHNWAQQTRWAMQALWEETRKRPAFNNVLIQGPPLWMKGGPTALRPDVAALGDLSRWIDRGDVHLYPSDDDPEVQVAERLAVLEPIHPGKPVCVSEGGYTTAINRGYTGGASLVPPEVAGLYAPKHALVHLLGGRQFYSYELLDEAAPYADAGVATREGGFGLVETPSVDPGSWRRKPGFESMRRLLGLVRDVGGRAPVSLRVSATASGSTLRTALMSRSDGKHLLAIWQAVDLYEWDRKTLSGRYVRVNPLPVTISLDLATPVSVYEPSTRDTPVSSFTAQTFTQTVGAGMQILQIG